MSKCVWVAMMMFTISALAEGPAWFVNRSPLREAFATACAAQPENFSARAVIAQLRKDYPGQRREIDLLEESTMQFERLEALRTGTLARSRFARPEYAHRAAALIRSEDRDAVDIALRQTESLLKDLQSMRGVRDLAEEREALSQIRQQAGLTPVNDRGARRILHLRCCEVRRRIAFANPLLDFQNILFIEHRKNPIGEWHGDHMAGQYYGIHATKGEGLFVLENAFGEQPVERNLLADAVCRNGRFSGKKLPDGAYLSPDLSFDGKRVLFAYTEAAGYVPQKRAPEDRAGLYDYSGMTCSFTEENCWHLFSVKTDGTELMNVTDGAWNDFDPCWMPSGKIAFISDRRGGFGRCHMSANGGGPWFTYTLHAVNVDGSDMVRLSHHETCEWQPSIAQDGMIVYTRWDYVDRGFFQAHHPWTTTPDGRNALAIHGNYPRNWQDRPCMEMDLRAVPGSHKLAGVAAAHHGQTYGSIVLIDPKTEDDDAMAPVKVITPDERFPESEYGYYCREAAYGTPWPLSEDYYLCVFGYPAGSITNEVENYGIYLLDAFGNKELLYRNPTIACLSPIPLKARPMPPVIPETVPPFPVDLNQKRLNLDRPEILASCRATSDNRVKAEPGVVSIMNIYESRHAWPPDTKIKALRIIQVLPKSTPGRNNPAIGYGTEKNARAVLGTVPVEEDGSVSFYLRPYIPVYFQALDEWGMAVQSMRTDIYVSPRENLSCVGCHEKRKSAPPAVQKAVLATRRPPSEIAPEPEGSNPFSFVRLVQPVLDKHCTACHEKEPKAPKLAGVKDGKPWLPSYRHLQPFAFYYDGGGSFTESKTYPGKFGARASKLYGMLKKGHHDVALAPEELRRITLWLDCNSDFYGTYEHLQAQAQGEVVWPMIE